MYQPLPYRRHSRRALLSLAAAATLTACGGGGGGGDSNSQATAAAAAEPPVQALGVAFGTATVTDAAKTLRGTVLSTTATQNLPKKYIDKSVSAAEAPLVTNIAGATSAAGNAKCDVQVLRLSYSTINPQDAPKAVLATAKASAVLMVPGAGCPGPWPLLSQQHGTNIGKDGVGQEGVNTMAAYYGSQGYVVVMPDYHGYSDSSLPYHPYLQSEPSAAVVIDAVRAARNWLTSNGYGASLSSKLFLAGTSEGGYVTMAAQRSMERYFPSEFVITAVAPTSGPYQVQATFDQFLNLPDTAGESKTVGATFIIEGFKQRYGDVYTDPAEAYRSPWAAEMGTLPPLLPSATTSSDGVLRKTCKLPFNLKDPATQDTPRYEGCSDEPLLTADYVTSYFSPTGTGGGAQVRIHAGENNLLQKWTPISKTYVCYGSLDAMATPNAQAAQAYFQASGGAALLTVENLETETQPVIAQWMDSQTPLRPYHGQVEAPACTSWSRHTVFDTLR